MGRRLRNGALAYQKAAQKEEAQKPVRVERAAYHRAQAIGLLQRYLNHKLYENRHRKNSAIVLQSQLQKRLRYVQVTLVTGAPKARIELRGYRYRREAWGRWSGLVRPGPYGITVKYPGAKAIEQKVVATAGKAIIRTYRKPNGTKPRRPARRQLAARPPQPRPPQPPLALQIAGWSALALGLVGVAVGGVLLGLAADADARKQQLYQKALDSPPPTPQQTAEIQRLYGEANGLYAGGSGLLLASGGLALVGLGLHLWAALQPKKKP